MRSLSRDLLCATCCLLLALPMTALAQVEELQGSRTASNQQADTAGAVSISKDVASEELPDSPGVGRPEPQDSSPRQDASTPADQTKSDSTAQRNPQQDENQKLQRPVGTAAAEAPKVSGITAAEPAGIAIAPAKQHRVRTIAIKVGAILGASAALGTVIALTAATPSKPPGAH